MTAEEVATVLRVSESMVYKLRRSGALPAVRVGALLRFHPDAVRAYTRGELPARGPRRIL
jgi:excisionase family DNA binding protein